MENKQLTSINYNSIYFKKKNQKYVYRQVKQSLFEKFNLKRPNKSESVPVSRIKKI